ncbi:ParB/RepB/Spo0J family partition protein [Kordiimonas aquimaris]|uniref:ParB/RepB/Spo0J family partition protein n=1 Tax=Kordiimonas aquimaris TaxID=707591 RepID=UPI0021D3D1BE|nr:ParB/RepB/Spo0J family partition protein [Kordiimonas aquimaris]
MHLEHIKLEQLTPCAVNMRHTGKTPDVSDILPSIRARGVIVPLIVRAGTDPENYEVVAGQRRMTAAKIIAEESGQIEPLPCAVMESGDDAAALEISILENCARLDPDPMTQYEAFAALKKQGRTVEDIADTFGVTALTVKRRLALGSLIPAIRRAYRLEKIDNESIKSLTMASTKQQRDWIKLFNDKESFTPTGMRLRSWLFGGKEIDVGVALFDLNKYQGTRVSNLFGDDEYFSDSDQFWTLQNQAIAALGAKYKKNGWQEVHVLDLGKSFYDWEHVATSKHDGGHVYIAVAQSGAVKAYEGYITEKEAKARLRAKATIDGSVAAKPLRPEISQVMQNYLALHRHAAVQVELTAAPKLALRVTVAHMIIGTDKWRAEADAPRPKNDAIAASLKNATARKAFADRRKTVLKMIKLPEHQHTLISRTPDAIATTQILAHLLTLSDSAVMKIMAFAMAETLAANSPVVEAVGNHLSVDMSKYWKPEQPFFDLIREKATVNAILREVGGKAAADGNVSSTAKAQKAIIGDFLEGRQGRKQVSPWLPRFLQFPFKSYTKNGGIGIQEGWEQVKKHFNDR